jgi:hypothetical protein
MNIHAGITNEDIIYFFKKTKELVKSEDSKMLNEKKKNLKVLKRKIKKHI